MASNWGEVAVVEIVDLELVLDAAQTRDHADELADRAHVADLFELFEEVFEVEVAVLESALHDFGILFAEFLLGAFGEGAHVAAAEDAAGEAVGWKASRASGAFADAEGI